MRLITVPGVFRPRSDSWMLARRVVEHVSPGEDVLDPFTGSGILAIAAARAGARATAVDISRRAVSCARLNARLNGVSIRALHGDVFAPVGDRRFDLIVANPPYLPSVDGRPASGAARAWEAGPDGRDLLDRLCRDAPARLRPGGRLLVVHSSVCDPAMTERTLADRGLEVSVIERSRGPLGPLLAARASVLEARGRLAPGKLEEEMLIVRAAVPVPA
jgi:release factor glutamine methyltransferase